MLIYLHSQKVKHIVCSLITFQSYKAIHHKVQKKQKWHKVSPELFVVLNMELYIRVIARSVNALCSC